MVALILTPMIDEPVGEVAIERGVEVSASPEDVWERITNSTLISDWMDGEVTIDPEPGGRITFLPAGGPEVWGTVEEVIVTQRIQWSWRSDEGRPSLIEFELAPGSDEETTVVTVRETLLPWRISGPDGITEWPEASLRSFTAVNAA
jgi:uncharacterized protein YndB with AHSA1/START domain